jgi:beta-N-acetylhexosaminidase
VSGSHRAATRYNTPMPNYYRIMVARMDGAAVAKDLKRCLSLTRKGIAGFIIFGGRLDMVRAAVKRLQEAARETLIIASDLERGLGQQLEGGSSLPPAMALARAFLKDGGPGYDLRLIRRTFTALAREAEYAGINTILAPVLDINTNPKNPIIAARAFGEDSRTVSFLGRSMINAIQDSGIAACGKHFPGHGDTDIDSHIGLPVVNRPLRGLRMRELRPFADAVDAGVKSLMIGHLGVPAIDPSGVPLSLSPAAVRFLRGVMQYNGVLMTDAMNMGGLGGYTEEEASLMAVNAGIDLVLHPSSPDKTASYLRSRGAVFDDSRLREFREGLVRIPGATEPPFAKNRKLCRRLSERAITITGRFSVGERPLLIILNDEAGDRGRPFAARLRKDFPLIEVRALAAGDTRRTGAMPHGRFVIVAVFSETRAWKGGSSTRLKRRLSSLRKRADLIVSFGSPYLLQEMGKVPRIFAYWDAEDAQEAAAAAVAAHRAV